MAVARLTDVTDPGYVEGLEEWPLEQVRARRDEATEIETGLSYLRRIAQGRLDIVVAEQNHRRLGQESGLADLVDELPAILGDNVHAPGLGRLPTLMAPGQVDPEIESRLEAALPADRLGGLGALGDDELSSAISGLTDVERYISAQRKATFEVLDRLQDEIVRRYRTGEATVDSLLR